MSICPTPPLKRKTDYATVGSISLTAPQPKYEFCQGGTTAVITSPGDIITSTVCCPSPGPEGPPGPPGSFVLKYDGTILGEISSLDVKGLGLLPEIIGTEASLSTTCMRWNGDWTVGTAYKKYDVVRNAANGNGYACMDDHTSAAEDIPEGDGGFYWEPITDVNKAQMAPEDKSFLEDLKDNILDYIMNADTVGEWLTILAAGAGIIYAGTKILEMFSGNGVGDGQASSTYNGTLGYNGAFVPVTLPVIVASLMEFAGYDASRYDVSLLPTDQVNLTLNSTITVRTVLQQLALVYQFDIVPSGGVVKFVPKWQPVVRTLTIDDLGHQIADDSLGNKAPYTAKRLQGIDLPRSVTMTYYSAELDYNKFTQLSTLETFEEGQDVKLEVPMTLIDADAKRISETSLVNAHIEQQQYTFTTDYHNIDLEPGDVIRMPLDTGGLTTVRVVQITEQDDGILEMTVIRAENNETSYNVSPIPQVTPPEQVTNVPGTIGYSQSLFLEVPPLVATETGPRLKVAVHGYAAPGWPGAIIYRSADGGVTYEPVASATNAPVIGLVASTTPAPADYHVWDTTTVITVQVKEGTLSNATDIAVQNGANRCMVGEEVIGFVNATLVAANTYQLSRLLRGRAGSEVKCGSHVINELFVMLDDNLVTLPFTTAEIGQTFKFKTVTIGSDISKVAAEDVKPYALNMRPWAVGHLKAVRETNDDWTISWVERPRYDNDMKDYVELTHDADWAGFAIGIFSGATVVHKATSTGPTYTYTAAQQVTDFGVVQTTLNLAVSQISTITAGGYPTNITV